MPIIRIEISEGRSPEVKANIAKEITEVVARNAELDPAKIIIFFTDVPRHNQSVGGQMRGVPATDS